VLFTDQRLSYDWRFLGPALAIIAAAILSFTVARYPGEAVKQIVRYVEVLVVFFLIMTNAARDASRIKRLVLYLIIGGLLASTVGLIQFLTGTETAGVTRRVYGWHGGGYGAVVSSTVVLALVNLVFERDRAPRLWSAITLPVAGIVLILAQTRAWIGALILVLAILLSRVRKDIALRVLVAVVLLGAVAWLLIQTEAFGLVDQEVIEGAFKRSFRFVGSRKDAAVEDLSIFMRFNVWIAGVGYFLSNPLTGIGVGSLRIQDYFTARLGPPEEGVGFVDNQYLQFFAEAGVVAGAAWLVYVFVGARLGWRVVRRTAGSSLYAAALGIWGSYLVYAIGSFFWVVTPHHELFAFMVLFTALLVNLSTIAGLDERTAP
jgi:O-antigen ligase